MQKTADLKILGSVLYVLGGNVDDAHLNQINPSIFRFALGAGTFSTTHAVGETLVLESRPHISWVENGVLKTETQPIFKSPFLMGIDHDHPVGKINNFKPSSPVTLQAFYEDLIKKYPLGFAVVTQTLFKQLHATYMKKPPIFHENINAKHEEYWADLPPENQAWACFFGVVLPSTALDKYPNDLIKRAFYQNPKESQTSPFSSHTHAVLLEKSPEVTSTSEEFTRSFQTLNVRGTRHLLTSSVIQESTYILFPIHSID